MRNQPTTARKNHAHYTKTVVAYTFIRDFIRQEGYAPSVREIAHGCGLGPTLVLYHLRRLTDWGLIRRAPGKVRSIILVGSEEQRPWLQTQLKQPGVSETRLSPLAEWPLLLEGQG